MTSSPPPLTKEAEDGLRALVHGDWPAAAVKHEACRFYLTELFATLDAVRAELEASRRDQFGPHERRALLAERDAAREALRALIEAHETQDDVTEEQWDSLFAAGRAAAGTA